MASHFCYLYTLHFKTDISLEEFESCDSSCKYYQNGGCGVHIVKNEHLSKEKFGWMIDYALHFKNPVESKSKNTRYVSVVSLIHPSEHDVWIIYSLRLNKRDSEWYPLYRYHQAGDMKEFDSLMALNTYFKKIGYNGRKLTDVDFVLKEKI